MSCITTTTLVPIQHPTGVELTANLAFEKCPQRLETRLKTLQKYISKYPTGWKKRLELAEVLSALGDWKQAAQEYRRVLDRQPHLLEVWLQLSRILRLLDRPKDAIAAYQSALEQVTDAATHHHIQGLIHECESCDVSATIAFQQAIDAEVNNVAHWYALAQSYIRQDEVEAAINAYDHILEQQPDDAIALSHKADLLWALTAYAESIRCTEQVLAIASNHAPGIKRILDHRCRSGLVQGDEKRITTRLLKRLQKLAPHTPETAQSEAYYYAYQGNLPRGKEYLTSYCQEHPKNPFGFYYNALFLFDWGDIQASVANIWQAYRLYPSNIEIFRALCKISSPVDNVDTRFDQVLEQQLEKVSTQWQMSLICGRAMMDHRHQAQRGYKVAKQAIQLKPQLSEAWFQYGNILALSQNYQDAIDAISTGWELLPEKWFCASSIPAAVVLAECHQKLGQLETSKDWWNEVLERSHLLIPFFPKISKQWQERAIQEQSLLKPQ